MKAAWLVGLGIVLAACASPTRPEGDPAMTGEIVRVGHGLWSRNADDSFQIHVKSEPDEECGIIFDVDDRTWIADSRGGNTRKARREILAEGARVEVWFGLVLDSCPGQSYAEGVHRTQ